MFTGIIECIGEVKSVSLFSEGLRLSVIAGSEIVKELKIGDSVAVNGVCQTAVKFFSGGFEVQTSKETLAKSNMGGLKPGDKVNLETALKLSTPLGGHLVLGHVDGVGVIKDICSEGFSKRFIISCDQETKSYIVQKGSVTLDGISLTIADVIPEGFSVSVIPHTLHNTCLQFRLPGDKVNIESDIIGKYVVNFLKKDGLNKSEEKKASVSEEFLKKAGFIGF